MVTNVGGLWRPGAFRVLVVSERSQCRAPAAEWLLRAHLRAEGRGPDVSIGSAGTRAVRTELVHPETVRALAELEVGRGDHVVRELTQRRAAQADLVLAADAGCARAVAELWPAAESRTFTLAEFARLARRAEGAASPVALVAELHRDRQARPGRDDDLPDPARGGYADHRRTVRRLHPLTRQIARAIALARRAETGALQPV